MPMSGGSYVAPTWVDNGPPALDATELQAMSDTIEANQTALKDAATIDNTTATVSAWSISTTGNGLYTATISIPGLTNTDTVFIKAQLDITDIDSSDAIQAAWDSVYYIGQSSDALTLYAKTQPSVAIPFEIAIIK